MNAILVSPSEKGLLMNAGDRLPLGISYMSSALTSKGISNRLIDLNHTNFLDAVEFVYKEKPDVIGISVPSSPMLKQMRAFAFQVSGATKHIVVGGNHVTFRPEFPADAIVLGEGECYLDAFKERGIFKGNFDINKFPIPDRTKLPSGKYNMMIEGKRTTGMVSSRGCPFSCDFCGITNHKVQYRSLDNILEELQIIKSQEYQGVYFYDDNFLTNRGHSWAVGVACRNEGLAYRVEGRADLIDNEVAKHLKETGCMMVAIGIESMDEKVLNAIGKREKPEQFTRAIETLGNYGIPVKGYFMFGLPNQTVESSIGTIQASKLLRNKGLTYADFYVFTPYPGSRMGDHPEKYGIRKLVNDYSQLAHAGLTSHSTIETDWMNKSQIELMVKEARQSWN